MSSARVQVKPDTLDDENRKFAQRPLDQPLFLNSIPKGGSHLLRNIVRMFVPVGSQYQADFIQYQHLPRHMAAFDAERPMLSWGHLFAMESTRAALSGVRHVLLVRDPYDWVLARARFILSEELQIGMDHLKDPDVPIEAILDLMIEGTRPQIAPLAITYTFNAVDWIKSGVPFLRYEDLVGALENFDSAQSEGFFERLFETCGIVRPDDWRQRVRIGADRKQSGTARENLTGAWSRIPSELPEAQKRLVDRSMPGLRELLGYA